MVSDNHSRRIPSHGSKWNLGVTKQASNSGLIKMMNALKMNGHDSRLMESFFRRVIRDEVERKLQEHLFSRDKINEAGKSGSRLMKLCFMNNNKLPNTTFTKTNIIPNDETLQVVLFDVSSKSIVNDGPFSSIQIQICPIQGKFESCDDEDWTETEFNHNILQQRDNKEPLLIGDKIVALKNGVASISEIKFTDNSSWVKSGKFSLGAKAMKNGDNIKEARSQAFTVKDIRGEAYKKHYPPLLKDDVWRLEKIAENGPYHKRLHTNKIHTVKDLLRLLIINESSLHEKFGKIQKKCWLDIIEHARSCVVDDYMLYSYQMIEHPITLLFNVIYELVGVTFDKLKFYLPDGLSLTPNQKNLVEIVKKDAYQNIEKLKAIDEGILNSISLEACIKSTQEQDVQGYGGPFISSSNVNDGMQNVEINVDVVADISEIPENSYGHSTYTISGASANNGMENVEMNVDLVADISEIPENSYGHSTYTISGASANDGMENVEMNFDPVADIREISESSYVHSTENLINLSPFYTTPELDFDALHEFLAEGECSSYVDLLNFGMDISNSEKPKVKAVWCKIRSVVKWRISGKRGVAAAKRNEGLSCYKVYDMSAIL